MVMLYDQFGREMAPSESKKPERRELSVAPIIDSFREYVTDGLTPERLAAVFRKADAGDMRSQAELFELIEEKDAHLLCERDKRKNVILDVDFNVEPASDDARDVKVAEFVEQFFTETSDWDENLVALQDAVGKGYSCLEIDWDTSEGQAVPQKFDYLKQQRFLFVDEKGMVSKIPRLQTDEEPMGIDIPAWKTIMHSYGGKPGMPNRTGIYRVCAWMVLFKNYSIKDWVIFCELFGMPLRLGKYSPGATDADKDALYSAISSLGSDAAGVISEATKIEFIESAKGSSASDLWQRLADFSDAQMSKAVLGGTLTTQVDGKGSYAASQTHNEVRLDLLQADGRALAGTVRYQLVRPLVGFNFGWDTKIPKFTATFKEAEDLDKKAGWISKMLEKGMPMGLNYLRKQFSVPEPEDGEEIIRVNSSQPADPEDDVAKLIVAKMKEDSDTIDHLVEKAMAETSMDDLLVPAKALLNQVDSLEEFRDGLLSMYGAMDAGKLAEVMERSFVLADLSGRFDEDQNGK